MQINFKGHRHIFLQQICLCALREAGTGLSLKASVKEGGQCVVCGATCMSSLQVFVGVSVGKNGREKRKRATSRG